MISGELYKVRNDKISCIEKSTGIGTSIKQNTIVTFLYSEPHEEGKRYYFLYDGKILVRWVSHPDTAIWWFEHIECKND